MNRTIQPGNSYTLDELREATTQTIDVAEGWDEPVDEAGITALVMYAPTGGLTARFVLDDGRWRCTYASDRATYGLACLGARP